MTTSEDTPVTGSVLTGTSSVDGPVSVVNFTIGATTYTAGSTATIANVGTLVIAADGAYTFTPAANYNGTVPTRQLHRHRRFRHRRHLDPEHQRHPGR